MSTVYRVQTPISTYNNPDLIESIEKQYDCRHIMEACINSEKDASGSWLNSSWLLFYSNKDPHPNGSKWLAFGHSNDKRFVVTDGQSIANHEDGIFGYYNPNTNEAVYSLYRWDNRWDQSRSFAIDGGRDYTKISGSIPKGFLYGRFQVKGDAADDSRDAGLYFYPSEGDDE